MKAQQNQMNRTATIGLLLVITGLLALLSNFGYFRNFGGLTGGLIFGGLGAYALNEYRSRRKQSWLLLGGFVLLGLAAASLADALGGAYFLALSGLGFLFLYREEQRHWWALLPGGGLLTLGAVAATDVLAPWLTGGAVFFAGVAATFGAVYALPRSNKSWAAYPALGSGALAIIILGTSGGWVTPVLLIGVGLYLLRSHGGPAPRPTAPAAEEPAGPAGELPAGSAQEVPESWQRPFRDGGTRADEPESGPDGGPTDKPA